MAAARVYLDEDVHPFIAEALRLRGWEAKTTVEADRCGSSDAEQLHFATAAGYVFLTYNVQDLPRIHYELLRGGAHHGGVIIATQEDPRRTIRAVLNLISSLPAEAFGDQLIYANNWVGAG